MRTCLQGFFGKEGWPKIMPDKLRTCGVKLCCVTPAPPLSDWDKVMGGFAQISGKYQAHGDLFTHVRSVSDLDRLAPRTIGLVYGLQETPSVVADEPDKLSVLYDMGFRVLQPAYKHRTPFGDGFLSKNDGGLTWSGHRLVEQMVALGMIVDVSHAGPQTALHAVKAVMHYNGHVMASHTTARVVAERYGVKCPSRGLSDEVLREIAKAGGVVGAMCLTFFLHRTNNTLEPWLDHVGYMLNVIGSDHVAVGSDAPIDGLYDLAGAEQGFHDVEALVDKDGEMGGHWPCYPSDVYTTDPRPFDILHAKLAGRFGTNVADKITDVNGERFLRRALLKP